MLKPILVVAAVVVLGVLVALFCINQQYAEIRLITPCTNRVMQLKLTFPKARNYHFVLRKESNKDATQNADVSGKITLTGSDGATHVCAFSGATLKQCNWLDNGTNRVEAYVMYLTRPTGTNEVWLKDFVQPGNEYRVGVEFADLPSTNCSIWLHWVTSVYTRLR
jgi:hypothetical protein